MKLQLAKTAPKTFPLAVKFATPFGEAEVNLQAKYMTASQWAAHREAHLKDVNREVEQLFAKAKARAISDFYAATPDGTEEDRDAAAAKNGLPPDSEILTMRHRMHADLLGKVVEGWDLEEPVNAESLTELADMYPAGPEAIFRAYNEAREGARLGN